jgi:hypothetical protein
MFSTKFSPAKLFITSACSCLAVSTVIALPLSLSLFAPSSQAQSRRVRYNPPSNLGTPIVSTPGATRSAGCIQSTTTDCLIGLVPDLVAETAPVPQTISARPTVYFLIPKVDGKVIFTLHEADSMLVKGKRIYLTNFELKSKAGILAFKIPDHVQSLKLNQNYVWEFIDSDNDLKVIGSMRRVLPTQTLVNQLKEVSLPIDRAALFAQQGLWYETVQTLAEALQANPKKPEIVSEWNDLLKSANLNKILPYTFVKTAETSSERITKPNQNYLLPSY